MRDAFGGLVNIAIIVVFMTIVSGYLAFNVSYTKAFKVKNKIISVYEEYDGCEGTAFKSKCDKEIETYINAMGYNAPTPGNFAKTLNNEDYNASTTRAHATECNNNYGYCVIEFRDALEPNDKINKQYRSFRVVTVVYLDIPIINNIMSGMNMFQITGDTKKMVYKP